jgi:hypothetical protein
VAMCEGACARVKLGRVFLCPTDSFRCVATHRAPPPTHSPPSPLKPKPQIEDK